MPRGLPQEVRIHVEKARESALLAVEVYNKPATSFRSGGFIVLMCIAWTSLMHAVFLKRGQKPYYRDPKNPRRYAKVDDEYKAWELAECAKQYWPGQTNAITKNLDFFIGLRNKVEHRSMPALDFRIFGECQALLFNFEDMLFSEFGAKYALNESLALALQFSHLRDENQTKAMAALHRPVAQDIENYIGNFRSALSYETLHDLQYSYKVFIVPKLSNHPGQADIAVEYVRYDPSKPEDVQNYQRLVAMIKPSVTQVANAGKLRAKDISEAAEKVVQQVVGQHAKFNWSYHHVRACYYYGIRTLPGQGDHRKTDLRYCHYDEAHNDYVYTQEWKKFLIKELKKPGQYEKILKTKLR